MQVVRPHPLQSMCTETVEQVKSLIEVSLH